MDTHDPSEEGGAAALNGGPETSASTPEADQDASGSKDAPARGKDLPDGSGTGKGDSADDHGQESGSEEFDAG